ncbi:MULTISPECIES: archaetidylserine decarboxylase [Thauera]|uniref:Phosphatidylserine decarboxylase proenzyme n=1 Tax=Thauera aminoaromatica TaxID=164330 RepID=C4KCE8_THASP|nr:MULTISPECIES: archaetidylserine decarboxylase [Thauera]MDA0233333.1 archaetidylserine decarboxylase [Pseudomonadota bacterium]ACR02339.1 phosphatidylserine decarboxylase [Thauera aminoaromatica]KIN89514.1 phosphatidylserine decarboxylase [Thauera sp. SWB20]MBL8461253.1 phosphatidylserine decarboxylase [Thauera sp.]MBP6132838.1 phosphatidylserine decarboxylase [Thauera sp.]
MSERLAVALQYALPKRLLTQLAGKLAGLEGGKATTAVIRWFAKRYGVNMAEAANADPASYASFNQFFTRPLREGVRPIADADFVCPVDGAISQFGPIEFDQVFQAKGHFYSTTALVGGDRALAARFENGDFATIYLSPRDYHRIHMPCAGRLTQMIHVPGELFSVNPATARGVPGLFARNERVVCVFEGEFGPFVMVLVGATIVGSMATVWHGVVNPPRRPDIVKRGYAEGEVVLEKGAEMGRFLLGSTVVMLFPQDVLRFGSDWAPGGPVRMGEPMARAKSGAPSDGAPALADAP